MLYKVAENVYFPATYLIPPRVIHGGYSRVIRLGCNTLIPKEGPKWLL